MDLDLVIDFAGFGSTITGAIKTVKHSGRVVVVGLGKTEFTFNSMDLISRAIDLQGSTPVGDPNHLREVLGMISSGDLKIHAAEIPFEEKGYPFCGRGKE